MPGVANSEQYRFITEQSNIGFFWLFCLVLALLAAAAALRPYFKRDHAFYLALAAGALARLGIMNRPTWYDEVFTLAVVRAPDFFGAILGDVHPPLHYAIVKLFTLALGDSIVVLRLPSLLASLGLIYAVYRLAWVYTKEKDTAQIAAVLAALLGAPLSYAAEARHPALLALCVIGGLLALAERRSWLLALCAIAAAYLHSIGMVYAALFVLAALRLGWLRTAAGIAAASCLWLPAMLAQSAQVSDGFWLLAQNPLKHITEMTVFTMDGVEPGATIFVYSIVLAWTIGGVYMSRHWILKQRNSHWLMIAIGVPVLLAIISLLWKPVYLSRALLAPALLLTVTWAYAWNRVHWSGRALLMVAVILSWSGVLIEPAETFDTRDMKELFTECAGADYVYVTSTNMAIQAMAYSPVPVRTWRHGNNIDQQLNDEAKDALGMFLINGYEALPEGEICIIAQVSHRTNETERQEINHIRSAHALIEDETLYQDKFYAYQLMRFINHGRAR